MSSGKRWYAIQTYSYLNAPPLILSSGVSGGNNDPNAGIVTVPDSRLDVLARIARTAVVIPAAIEFVDIAGLVRGASQGEGLGNKFLTHIREVDAIIQVVRCFEDPDVHHVSSTVDPVRDIEVITTELILADLEQVSKRRERLAKDIKRGDKAAAAEESVLGKIEGVLDAGKPALLATRVKIKHCYFHCARSIVRAGLWKPETWPAAGRISFGKIIAPRMGQGEELADQIDTGVAGAYKERLWVNS